MNTPGDLIEQLLLGPRVRQNHALEHATIHLLSAQYPRTVFRGRAIPDGFYLYIPNAAPVTIGAIHSAAHDALARLRGSQPGLAVHPQCGTMLAVTGLITGVFATLAGDATRVAGRPASRYPWAVLVCLIGAFWSQPLGLLAQRHITTLTPRATLRVLGVRQGSGLFGAHIFVETTHHPL